MAATLHGHEKPNQEEGDVEGIPALAMQRMLYKIITSLCDNGPDLPKRGDAVFQPSARPNSGRNVRRESAQKVFKWLKSNNGWKSAMRPSPGIHCAYYRPKTVNTSDGTGIKGARYHLRKPWMRVSDS